MKFHTFILHHLQLNFDYPSPDYPSVSINRHFNELLSVCVCVCVYVGRGAGGTGECVEGNAHAHFITWCILCIYDNFFFSNLDLICKVHKKIHITGLSNLMARVPKTARGKISLARSIHRCPNIFYFFRPTSISML